MLSYEELSLLLFQLKLQEVVILNMFSTPVTIVSLILVMFFFLYLNDG